MVFNIFEYISEDMRRQREENQRLIKEAIEKYGDLEPTYYDEDGFLRHRWCFLKNEYVSLLSPTMENMSKIRELKEKLSNLGYYTDEVDESLSPSFYKALNDYSEDDRLDNRNINNRLNDAYNKLGCIKNFARVDFDGEYLRFIENGDVTLELPAMSGKGEYQEKKYQNLKNMGPLPEGNYRIRQKEIQEIKNSFWEKMGVGNAPGGWISWGKKRVWLEPFSSNMMYDRDNFSIHGGASFGSLGCIDLGNRELDFFDKLEKYGRDVILNVRYKKEKLR